MDLGKNDGMPRRSLMSITGRNALTALGVGIIATVPVALLLGVARLFFDSMDNKDLDFAAAGNQILGGLIGLGICITPVVFILTFALLQRIRIR